MKRITVIILAAFVAACGGGGTNSGGGGSPIGPTANSGEWVVIAKYSLTIEDGNTERTTTSTIFVDPSGNVGIQETDAVCTLQIFVNGDTLTYEEKCPVTGSTCIVNLQSRATFVAATHTLSGAIGPDSFICGGRRIAFAGNLTGSRKVEQEAPAEEAPAI